MDLPCENCSFYNFTHIFLNTHLGVLQYKSSVEFCDEHQTLTSSLQTHLLLFLLCDSDLYLMKLLFSAMIFYTSVIIAIFNFQKLFSSAFLEE